MPHQLTPAERHASAAHVHAPAAGKPLHAYAGKEVARALAKGSTEEVDTGSAVTHDLGQEEAQRLEAATAEYVKLYDEVGQVGQAT